MATAGVDPTVIRDHPRAVVAVISIVGYGLVIGTFAGLLPVYPELTRAQVNLLSHAIAAVNTLTIGTITAGWLWIRRGEVRKHAAAMTSSFLLILAFLGLYLLRVGGGPGEKRIVIESTAPLGAFAGTVRAVYLGMLAVHVLLSILAVPIVLYVLTLAATRSVPELRESPHARVGRIAASVWLLSLVLGVVTYLLLNHVYAFEFVEVSY